MPPSTNKNKFVKILNIVNEILKFNEQIRWGQGLKILTPNQMLSRLPVYLAQLKAGNNSNKLKNETRQLLSSLQRSKKLTKQLKVLLTLFKDGNNFMNSENCKTSEPHRVRPDLTDKLNLDLQKHGFSQCDTWKTMILLELYFWFI